MRRIYLLSVEELKEPETFEELLGQACPARREKTLRCARREDQVRSLGAGLLLQYGLGVWGEVSVRDGVLPGEEVPVQGEVPVKDKVLPRDDSPQCAWQMVSLKQLREKLPFEKELTFHYGAGGKPYLDQFPLFFSLSHSGDYAACGISDFEIGVDIQEYRGLGRMRRVPESCDQEHRNPDCSDEVGRVSDLRLAERFFAAEEWRQLWDCMEEGRRQALFYRFWTQKESFGKLTGEGLKAGLSVGSEQKMRGRGAEFSYYDGLPGYSVCACWYRDDAAMPESL